MIRNSERRRTGRAGFTLIEVLVVLFIIGILVTLSTAAAVRLMAASYTSTTRTTMQRANGRLQQQMAYIIDLARKEKIPRSSDPGYTTTVNDAYSMSKDISGNSSTERARVIHIKFRLQQYFPMTFTEALSPKSGYPPVSGYISFLNGYGITSGNAVIQPHESAICLYMILRYGPETTGEDDLGLNASSKPFGGAPGLVDAWGNPLFFCRWPVGDPTANFVSPVNPSGFQPGMNDPVDPKGQLTVASWLNSTSYSSASAGFAFLCHPLPPRSQTGGPQSVNLTPVIVSSGADKTLGLSIDPTNAPLAVSPAGNQAANDNIYTTYIK
jgi:prepilin-type N-terminal cleavage/methylation domain-containing protein